MHFMERAKIRLEHWITHNDHHQEEYKALAQQLEEMGKEESAEEIREMTRLRAESNECLHKALKVLQ